MPRDRDFERTACPDLVIGAFTLMPPVLALSLSLPRDDAQDVGLAFCLAPLVWRLRTHPQKAPCIRRMPATDSVERHMLS